ncbi:hypothetical protein PISL3812_03345 [Talaromyces islandicus]|uniref:Uncharacterized protein n=1 Tax=Talaromyces islandicus TaxID=28573 RepID=A0A0U1LUU2_TALIS|nr:hypothetical protein PISL3812_03345 [Talaromyces islandicus]
MDNVTEDLNRSKESRATGFLGKNSSAAWMRSLVSEVDKVYGVERSSYELPKTQINSSVPLHQTDSRSIASQSYYDNQRGLFGSEFVDPYALPPRKVADEFYNKYLESVDKSFPIIRKSLFTQK